MCIRDRDTTERVTRLGRRTREEIVKWDRMTALRFQTGGDLRYPRDPFGGLHPKVFFFGRAPKKNTSYGNEVLPQDTTHLIQRPCYQRGSLCQDPAGSRTTRRSSDDRKETQTAVVWSCFPLIRSGQNYLARHSDRGRRQGRQR